MKKVKNTCVWILELIPIRIRQNDAGPTRSGSTTLVLGIKVEQQEGSKLHVFFQRKTESKSEHFRTYIRGKFLASHNGNEPGSARAFYYTLGSK